MSDLHEIGRAAADAAELPDFELLRARGERRQTVRRTAWVGVAAVAVVGVIGVAQLAGRNPAAAPIDPVTTGPTVTSSPAPTEETSSSNPQPDPLAAAIVDDPLALMTDLRIDPEHPDVMASLWQCTDPDCEQRGAALALTGDGFATRTIYRVERGGLFAALGGGAFHYKANLGFGDVFRVPGVDAPASGGAVVSIGSGLRLWTLVDADGSSHPIENAEGFNQIMRTVDGGLTALGADQDAQWVVARSTDLGVTWHRQRLTGSAPTPLFSIIPSAGAPALLESADGATVAPVLATWRLEHSGQWVRHAAPAGDTAYTDGQVVLPDGRLLTAVMDWNPQGLPGFYVSDEDDWSTMTRVSTLFPDDFRPYVLATSVSARSVTMVVADPQTGYSDEGWRSTDAQSWDQVRLR